MTPDFTSFEPRHDPIPAEPDAASQPWLRCEYCHAPSRHVTEFGLCDDCTELHASPYLVREMGKHDYLYSQSAPGCCFKCGRGRESPVHTSGASGIPVNRHTYNYVQSEITREEAP